MKTLLTFIVTLLFSSTALADHGLIRIKSNHSVKATADKFEAIAKEKGLTVFARINHQQNAQKVGKDLRPTELIIFGNPKVGTPLMQCSQAVAIDLPQKFLITEDENKQVWLSYNNPSYLQQRHDIKNCDEVLMKITGVLKKLSAAATK